MTIRLLLVDDHQVLRQGLNALLGREADFCVVGEAADGSSAIQIARNLCPDVVVLDMGLPDIGGVAVARRLTSERPETKVIALSMYTEPRLVTEMLKAGAKAYVLKCNAFEDLAKAIRVVAKGGAYLSPGITQTVLEDYRQLLNDKPQSEASSSLTGREREITELFAKGHSTSEISGTLNISPKTVATHRKNIMDKLHIRSVVELTRIAIREGWVILDP